MFQILRDKLQDYRAYRALRRSGLFDGEYYLRQNLDVARSCMDPLKHYLRFGWKEGRDPNPLFNTGWYLERYEEAARSGQNPLLYYYLYGAEKNQDPSPGFSTADYLRQNPEASASGMNPLSHFIHSRYVDRSVLKIHRRDLPSRSSVWAAAGTVAVHAHIYYPDLACELVGYLNNIPCDFDCCITTDTEAKRREIRDQAVGRLKARKTEVLVTPNVGRDIAPFVVGCRHLFSDYTYLCHVHTKKSTHADFGDRWRRYLLERLMGSADRVRGLLGYFESHPEVGLIYPSPLFPVNNNPALDSNGDRLRRLRERLGLRGVMPGVIAYPAGSMFWGRTDALRRLALANLQYAEFEREEGQVDGTLAHAFERIFVYVAREAGYTSRML